MHQIGSADELSLALLDARNHSLRWLQWFEAAGGEAIVQRLAGRRAPLWYFGHLGWFGEYWIGRNIRRHLGAACPVDAPRLASIEPNADLRWHPALLDAGTGPADADLPRGSDLRAWLLATQDSTLELLERADDDGLYMHRLVLYLEDRRQALWAALAQALDVPAPLSPPAARASRPALLFPDTPWVLGAGATERFVPDIELGRLELRVPAFEIDAQPVTWAQYVEFVDDGGYDRPELWAAAGWDWLTRLAAAEGRRGPRHVELISAATGMVSQRWFGQPRRMAAGQPVTHVSWWEADAWCRWAGRRLPTEVEWELAAVQGAGRGFVWGDVVEWTLTPLRPWPGHRPLAWSHDDPGGQAGFGGAMVCRGASLATAARLRRTGARGFAWPDDDRDFVGFRSCAFG